MRIFNCTIRRILLNSQACPTCRELPSMWTTLIPLESCGVHKSKVELGPDRWLVVSLCNKEVIFVASLFQSTSIIEMLSNITRWAPVDKTIRIDMSSALAKRVSQFPAVGTSQMCSWYLWNTGCSKLAARLLVLLGFRGLAMDLILCE